MSIIKGSSRGEVLYSASKQPAPTTPATTNNWFQKREAKKKGNPEGLPKYYRNLFAVIAFDFVLFYRLRRLADANFATGG